MTVKCKRMNIRTEKLFGHVMDNSRAIFATTDRGPTVISRCKRCSAPIVGLLKVKPYNDKRNFKRSHPLYRAFQKYIRQDAQDQGYVLHS